MKVAGAFIHGQAAICQPSFLPALYPEGGYKAWLRGLVVLPPRNIFNIVVTSRDHDHILDFARILVGPVDHRSCLAFFRHGEQEFVRNKGGA